MCKKQNRTSKLKNNKTFINNPKESWITDRFRREWYKYNKKNTTRLERSASLIWLIAPWTWKNVNKTNLKNKKVLCTIHHIDEQKFDSIEKTNFFKRDEYVDAYHVPSLQSLDQLSKLTDKKIFQIPFWVNQNIFYVIQDKKALRRKFNINEESFVVGSFQRDTEGFDLITPKFSKGPDLFVKNVVELNKIKNNLVVLLAGYRRQYVINELEKNKIMYKYFEKPKFRTINELYNCLDLYIVSSRVEGGPAAIIECATTKTPIVSTDVGIARQILDPTSIYSENNFSEAKPNIEFAYKKSLDYTLTVGMNDFNNMIEEINEN